MKSHTNMDSSMSLSTKPWYLYTLEDDAHFYDEGFELEALLCPTPTGSGQEPQETQLVSPDIQEPSNPEDRNLVQVLPFLVQDLLPLEESALVMALREELERARPKLADQVQINNSLDHKLRSQERINQEKDLELKKLSDSLQKKDKQLQDQMNAHKEIRYLYNSAVQKNVQLKQELANSKKVRNKTDDLVMQKLKASLQKKDKEPDTQINAYKEIRYLYSVQLKQELSSTSKVLEKMKEQLKTQDNIIAEMTNTNWSDSEACRDSLTTGIGVGGDVTHKDNEKLSRKVQELLLHSSQLLSFCRGPLMKALCSGTDNTHSPPTPPIGQPQSDCE